MKHLLWAAYFIFFAEYTEAQFYKGEKLLGGNFQITNNFNSPIVNGPNGVFFEGDKTFSITLTPQIISFFADNKAIGLQTGAHYFDSKQGPGDFEGNGFDFGVFFKQYKFFYRGLALAYSVGPNYAMSIEKSNGSKYKNTLASVQLSPYLVYRFSDHFSLESSLGKAGIGRSTVKDEINNITAKRTDYFIGMFTGFNLSAYYVFGKKRSGTGQ
jgi:hypothetical protein